MVDRIAALWKEIAEYVRNEKGQTMIEYALVAVLIAIILVFIFKQGGVDSGISTAASKVSSALSQ